jgi:two-component system response regulator NreC
MAIRVLIADDHAIVRHGLSRSVEQEPDMEVVGLANNGHQAVELARETAPNIVVMDISMHDLNGIEAARLIRRQSPGTRVIALSMHSASRYVREMFKAGAAGYLLKDCEFDETAKRISPRRSAKPSSSVASGLRHRRRRESSRS